MLRWFAISTQPSAEERAAQNLARQGFGIYLPRYRKTRRHARRVEEVLRPLFPGYLFVQFDAAQSHWRAIRSTVGVRDVVLAGDKPSPVADAIVNEIRAREDEHGVVRIAAHTALKPGDKLLITRGPLSDLVGLFHCKTDGERVVVLLQLLGREIRVPLSGDSVDAQA